MAGNDRGQPRPVLQPVLRSSPAPVPAAAQSLENRLRRQVARISGSRGVHDRRISGARDLRGCPRSHLLTTWGGRDRGVALGGHLTT